MNSLLGLQSGGTGAFTMMAQKLYFPNFEVSKGYAVQTFKAIILTPTSLKTMTASCYPQCKYRANQEYPLTSSGSWLLFQTQLFMADYPAGFLRQAELAWLNSLD